MHVTLTSETGKIRTVISSDDCSEYTIAEIFCGRYDAAYEW